MGVAQVMANVVPLSPLIGTNATLQYYQESAKHASLLEACNDVLNNITVGDVTVRLVEHVEDWPQIDVLRNEINLDAHRVIDPNFILHEKKEIF